MKRKGLSTGLAVLLVIAALFVFGVLKFQQPAAIAPGPSGGTVVITDECQTDGSNDVQIAVQNKLATTASLYTRANIAAVSSSGKVAATGTSSGGATISYTTLSVPCSDLKGLAYVYSGTSDPGSSVNSVSAPYDTSGGAKADQVVLSASNVTGLNWCIRAVTDRSNVSESCDDGNSANETSAVTMAADAVRSRIVTFIGTTGGAQFGTDSHGLIWSIDTADSTVFSDNAISVSSGFVLLSPIDCPARIRSQNSAERCWKSGPVKTSDGQLEATVTISADLGNPGTSADPVLFVDDVQCFEEDGIIVCDTHTKGGTNVGAARQRVGFDNS